MKDTDEIIYMEKCNNKVRAVKSMSGQGGPNMWNIEVQSPRGHWSDVQWMSQGNASSTIGKQLPSYKYKSDSRSCSELVKI